MAYDPDGPPGGSAESSANEYPFNKIVQYALVVREVKKTGAHYQNLGLGGMPFDRNISVDRMHRGKPGKFEMYLGWWHWPDVTFEWIQPLVGPSVYDEYLKAHREGVHDLAFEVKDMDEAVKLLEAKGAPPSHTGGWDSPGSKGRFAYLDTEPYGRYDRIIVERTLEIGTGSQRAEVVRQHLPDSTSVEFGLSASACGNWPPSRSLERKPGGDPADFLTLF